MAVEKLCPYCRCSGVVRDAWAHWDPDKGEWVLKTIFDQLYCEGCEKTISGDLIEVPAE